MKAFLNSKKLSLSLFFIYLFILTWIIVAKMDWSLLKSSNLSWLDNPKLLFHPGVTWRSINLVPFRNGNFDRFLVKPLHPLFQIFMEGFDDDAWGDLIVGIFSTSSLIFFL